MSTVTIRDAELKDAGYLLEIYSYAGSFVGRAAYNHSCEMTIYLDRTARKCGMGYTKVGEFHKCGYKFGRWYDMIWMEKMIGGHLDRDGS
ncbi:GNAT family N-acetyltransferase [Ruminococcus sp. CLA-AA-H200]|uniref:GNAT family N-acetyltransferase n=1 Tax=Ruminococcus turbiniformis TaxID=2881258 RepID=A0ABS8G0H8_9FIRM|nr:GNAT family N-acetyltransferase [Ruminococcus turbiniformis]MCC2255773.1 GNAT family N-acetyltransferase [Ruminococcus turbiniformis]